MRLGGNINSRTARSIILPTAIVGQVTSLHLDKSLNAIYCKWAG